MSKKQNLQENKYDYSDHDENEAWSEMSPERSSSESDEDYDERMSDLFGEDWNS